MAFQRVQRCDNVMSENVVAKIQVRFSEELRERRFLDLLYAIDLVLCGES